MQLCLVGLESFREEDLKDWRKRTTSEQNCEAIRILHRVGVEAVAYIVVNPDFTADDFDRVKQTVSDLELTHPIFTMLTPFRDRRSTATERPTLRATTSRSTICSTPFSRRGCRSGTATRWTRS